MLRVIKNLFIGWKGLPLAPAVGIVAVFAVVLLAISAPLLAPFDPHANLLEIGYKPPSRDHWLGTDQLGRDMLTLLIWGARTSLRVAFIGVSISMIIGIMLGVTSGYGSHVLDNLIMRFADIVLTFPTFFLLIVATSVLTIRDLTAIALIIGVIDWPQVGRIVRAEFLSIREQAYVDAAKALGASSLRIILRHILPNSLSPLFVAATLSLSRYILYEAAISFLGLGDPTAISWGTMIAKGQGAIRTAWWISTFPGCMIFITVLSLNLIGDTLRDRLDPRLSVGV